MEASLRIPSRVTVPLKLKRSRTVPAPAIILPRSVRVLKQGFLLKRQRGLRSTKRQTRTVGLKFQKRYVQLTTNTLLYFDNEREKSPNGRFVVRDITIVEEVQYGMFDIGKHYFQIGNQTEVMYFGARSEKERTDWIDAFRQAAKLASNEMLENYHPGVYGKCVPGQWSCCKEPVKEVTGCSKATPIDGAYYQCPRIERTQSTLSYETSPKAAKRSDDFDGWSASVPLPGGIKEYNDSLQGLFEFEESDCEMVSATPPPCAPVCKTMINLPTDMATGTNAAYVEFHKQSQTAVQPDGLSLDRCSMRSYDSGIEDTSKSHSKEGTPNFEGYRKKFHQQNSIPELDDSDHGSDIDLNSPETELEASLLQNGLAIHHACEYKSSLSASTFRGTDHLIVGGQDGKVHVLDVCSLRQEEDCGSLYEDFLAEVGSVTTWRNMIAVGTKSKVAVLDLDDNLIRHSLPSHLGLLDNFTPDGSAIIGADVDRNVIELWKLGSPNMAISRSINLPGQPRTLCTYPDPRLPLVAVTIPDPMGALYLHVYNYSTGECRCDKIFIGHLKSSHALLAVFSPFDKKLVIGHGNSLTVVDVKQLSTYHKLLNLDQDVGISCLQFSPTGQDLAVGLTNGSITVLDGRAHETIIRYTIMIEKKGIIKTLSYSKDSQFLAVGSNSGRLNIFRKLPARHLSECAKMSSRTIPRSGGSLILNEDDVSVDFPEGFIEKPSLSFEYNVTSGESFGPCSFPRGVRPVSAFLSLHPKEDITFTKPMKITMPHFIHLEDAEDCSKLMYYKARVTDYKIVNGHKTLQFSKVSPKEKVSLFTQIQNTDDCDQRRIPFATLHTSHCCHYCICECTRADTDQAMFYLVQAKQKNLSEENDFAIHYCLPYFLKSCLRNLDEQFPPNIYDRKMNAVRFKRKGDGSDRSIGISILNGSEILERSGWKATVENRNEICSKDVNFWDIPEATLECMCKEKEYPPRFTIRICPCRPDCEDTELKVVFPGAECEVIKSEEPPIFTVDLLASDVCLKERSMIRSCSAQYGHSHRSKSTTYEALAIQKSSFSIASKMKSSAFVMCLFSKMLLSNDQVRQLKISLPRSDRERVELNFDAILEVHSNTLKDYRLFGAFHDLLETMGYSQCSKELKDALEEFRKGTALFVTDSYSERQQCDRYCETGSSIRAMSQELVRTE